MFLLLKFWEGVDYIIPQLPSGLRLGVVSRGSFSSPEGTLRARSTQWSGAGWGQRYSNGFQSFTEVLKEEGQGEGEAEWWWWGA